MAGLPPSTRNRIALYAFAVALVADIAAALFATSTGARVLSIIAALCMLIAIIGLRRAGPHDRE